MAKSLVITEKPSVARDIADALGGFREEEGYFERDDMLVTFAVGHLYELLAPHLGNRGWGNTARVGDYKGVPMLFAERNGYAVALACSRPREHWWTNRSALSSIRQRE